MTVEQEGDYTIGISQKDHQDINYKYADCKILVGYRTNVDECLKFINETYKLHERDSYLPLKDLEAGEYFINVQMKYSKDNIGSGQSLMINSYGPSEVSFKIDGESYASDMDFLQEVFLSKCGNF